VKPVSCELAKPAEAGERQTDMIDLEDDFQPWEVPLPLSSPSGTPVLRYPLCVDGISSIAEALYNSGEIRPSYRLYWWKKKLCHCIPEWYKGSIATEDPH